MQFTAMSIWLFAALAVLTAGVLAALQYLRIRPRQVRVITTLFWQQAADQALARSLFERFRHPRTYLLLLAASLLLLLALAQPAFHAANQPHRVIMLDAGLAMTAADRRFDNAVELVRVQAASVEEDRVAVIAADPQPRVIKHFDEDLAAMEGRLARVKPAETPVIRKNVLDAARSLLVGRENGEMVLVTAQPVMIHDDRVRVLPAGEIFSNAFVLSAAFAADPGDLTRGAVEFRVGFTGKQAGRISVKVNRGSKELLNQGVDFQPGEVKQFTVAGIAGDGGILSVKLDGADAVAGDSRLDFQLPDRRRILIAPVDGIELPAALMAVLESLPEATTKTAEDANLPVIRVGPAGSDAQIRIHPADQAGPMMPVLSSSHALAGGLTFEDALCRAPFKPLDSGDGSTPLLMVNGSPVAVLSRDAKRLDVSASIFDEDTSLVRRTGYMVFWSNMLHHLAGWRDEPLTLSPVQASRSVDAGLSSSMLKADMCNFDLATNARAAIPAESIALRLPVWQLLLLAALVLMVVEAVLNIRGRIS